MRCWNGIVVFPALGVPIIEVLLRCFPGTNQAINQRRDHPLRSTILSEEGNLFPILLDIEEFVLDPQAPRVGIVHDGKRLFVIEVQKSAAAVLLGGKSYVRTGDRIVLTQAAPGKAIRNVGIDRLSTIFKTSRTSCTAARAKLLDHYESVLLILDDLSKLVYPKGATVPTDNAEGKMLMRILFSSCADNFEIFMSDLLFEIYLAKPETLKSNAQVTVKEVLDCTDMQEFITRYAKSKLKKLQRGSVKGFIADNKQIKSLGVFDATTQEEIEKLLQIRHLYAHQNGLVDERFREYFPAVNLNDEFRMTLDEFLSRLEYLAQAIEAVDTAARSDYQLASFS